MAHLDAGFLTLLVTIDFYKPFGKENQLPKEKLFLTKLVRL